MIFFLIKVLTCQIHKINNSTELLKIVLGGKFSKICKQVETLIRQVRVLYLNGFIFTPNIELVC